MNNDDLRAIQFSLQGLELTISFSAPLFGANRELSIFCRKRYEEKQFFLDYSIQRSTGEPQVIIDLNQLIPLFDEKTRLDFYLLLKDGEEETVIPLKLDKNWNRIDKSRFLEPVHFREEFYLSPYQTLNNRLSIIINTKQKLSEEIFDGYAEVKRLQLKNDVLKVKVKLSTEDTAIIKGLVLKHRKGERSVFLEADAKEIRNHVLTMAIDISKIEFEQFYWDFYLEVEDKSGSPVHLRVKNYSLWIKFKTQYFSQYLTREDDEGNMLLPYITVAEDLSINYRPKGKYEEAIYKRNEYMAFFLYLLFGIWYKRANIWLIHEKYSETAQDNAFSFFRYCYENHPEKKVYFVIKKESEDYARTTPYQDRVVHFMSIKHMFLLLASRRIVSSESKGHGFAWRVSQGLIKPILNQKRFIFLQHGVLGLKKIDNTFKANGNNHADLFVASSDFEKSIVNEYLGYRNKNIIVTGLARWDYLERSQPDGKQILCMPTWRNWLEEVSDSAFLQSDYFQNYYEMITSPELKDFLKRYDLHLKFYLHPKFIQYAQLFESDDEHIEIMQFGQKTVSELVKDSSVLITDYSSVAWEFFYLDKPVMFYQFDRQKYEEYQGSYMDLDNELFGKSSDNLELLIAQLEEMFLKGDFASDQEIKPTYFNYVDQNNSERIFQEIMRIEEQGNGKETLKYALKRNPLVRTAWAKYKLIRQEFKDRLKRGK